MEDIAPKVPTSLPSQVAPSASQPSSSSQRSCFFARVGERVDVAGDAHGVRDEDGARLRADGGLDLRRRRCRTARLAIDEDRDEAVLHERRQGGGKRDRRGDDFVAAAQAVLDLRAAEAWRP